jgi:Cytochrome P450
LLRLLWGQYIRVKHHNHEPSTSNLPDLFPASLETVLLLDIYDSVLLLTSITETISSLTTLFLALVLFPHAQKRAQAELDVVVGRDRLPTFNDRPRLPYIEAFCKEMMRWLMVTPLGTIWNFL